MSILQISVAYRGEWKIDFTDPVFFRDGIFAITGRIAAGKTTILDAICLALFGQTPRLVKITNQKNEVMNRQAGFCFAEATFWTQAGRFRCHFSQSKAYNRHDGNLRDPKHEISDARTGALLESKLKNVGRNVEEVTGMDFTRFTRPVLLTQGKFSDFLNAKSKDCSPILEQITGTAIYSTISRESYVRAKEDKQA
ncbi:MAG: AAA family ATPase [Desulfovibrio sp.]|nr:AAA family ATPase [Desulfovibrio sp.]